MKIPLSYAGYELVVTEDLQAAAFSFEPSLFNQPAYLALQDSEKRYGFCLKKCGSDSIDGVFFVSLEKGSAHSPYRAPYGSFEFCEKLPLQLVENFIGSAVQFLREKGVQYLQIKNYPFCYAPGNTALITNALWQLGATVSLSQLNHHIPVSELTFESLLHVSERRRLMKCQKAGFHFQLESAAFLPEAYALIKACRIQKNKPFSLSEPQLQTLFDNFPDRYFIFSVRNSDEIAAVTIAVKVRSDILLTAYPASPEKYNAFSPTVMLNEGLYRFCQQEQMKKFDLGISGTKADPHYSLMRFKEHLGGVPSLKFTFELAQ